MTIQTETAMLDQYFTLFDEVCKMFGYHEDWRAFNLDDKREYFWKIDDDHVEYCKDAVWDVNHEEYYGGTIYTQRHLSKWVYETEHYTMALVDIHCDCNVLLMIFENTKKVS